jgi:hypothetical protein
MTERNYYDVLGLTPDADGTAVNRTYWLLARKYQGEAASDPRAHHMLDELNDAYTVLGTPVLREKYDAANPATIAADEPATDPAWPGTRDAFEPRSPEASRRQAASRLGLDIGAIAPYAATIGLSAMSLGGGVWAGNLLLMALGASAALVAGGILTRHKIASVARDLVARSHEEGRPATSEPTPPRRLPAEPPMRATMVRRRGVQADELRLSTASMVGRWRSSVGATADAPTTATIDERRPDSTLVDIFRSEQELEEPSEPLSAVLDVLKGSRR